MPCQSVEHFVPYEDSEEGTYYEEDAEGVQSEMEESRPIRLCGENNGDSEVRKAMATSTISCFSITQANLHSYLTLVVS